ncbi:hypothetical protein [Nocardia thraciensis]
MSHPPVLVGPVPLLYVQSLTLSEGYRIEQIAGSAFSQALAPTTKTIAIEAVLPGPNRLLLKKALEVLALTSRVLVAATAPLLAVSGIPVVTGMTISLDMQITDLRFSQSTQKRDALDVSLTLRYVPRSSVLALASEAADLALAAGTAAAGSPPAPGPVPRPPGAPL